MGVMVMRGSLVAVLIGGAFGAAVPSRDARAAAAWGDATLRTADRHVAIDRDGAALVTEDIGLHVTAKHFRAFVVDGVDGAEAPNDPATTAGLDGLGWPIVVTDAKGIASKAFVEPAKEPRQLRVRLDGEGLPRGDFTVHLRYRVDLARGHRIVRDGGVLRLSIAAPRWPEGYDNGKVVVVLPAGTGEAPRITMADIGEAEHSIEGLALLTVQRKGPTDTVTLVRPHVPPHDDTRWILRVDPQVFPALAAATGVAEVEARPIGARGSHRAALMGAAALVGLLCAGLLGARDRAARRAAAALDLPPLRPLVGLPDDVRAVAYGLSVGAALGATALLPALTVLPFVALALALAIVRPPAVAAPRTGGRWLRVPAGAGSEGLSAASFLDPGGLPGALVAVALIGAVVAAIATLATGHPRLVLSTLMNVVVLSPLFSTARASQLRPCSVSGATAELLRVLAAPGLPPGHLVVRAGAQGPADVRVRFDVAPELAARGVRAVELGCGWTEGFAGVALQLELLLRATTGSLADRAISGLGSATSRRSLGRDATESATMLPVDRWPLAELFVAVNQAVAGFDPSRAVARAGEAPPTSGPGNGAGEDRRRAARALVAPAVGFGASHS